MRAFPYLSLLWWSEKIVFAPSRFFANAQSKILLALTMKVICHWGTIKDTKRPEM